MVEAFYLDAFERTKRRNRKWYKENMLKVLEAARENRAREVDASIALAKDLLQILNEPRKKPEPIPPHDLIPSEADSFMKPVEPEILNLLHGSTEKGATERYLKERNKKAPEDKFYYRATTNWEYGWQQKQSRMPARDTNLGRCAVLRDTLYRKNNLAPDPPHYAEPAGGEFSICSVYSCNFN
ncbi:unnamed protein product [Parnassius mnemosyne]|uniref:Sperm microtubule inner protein 1 C-terminal domain-containing protein n=1 Tax=Parnassius mnemosyne TaxID=213953 RepID=A0AAV1KP04_9NEOP